MDINVFYSTVTNIFLFLPRFFLFYIARFFIYVCGRSSYNLNTVMFVAAPY